MSTSARRQLTKGAVGSGATGNARIAGKSAASSAASGPTSSATAKPKGAPNGVSKRPLAVPPATSRAAGKAVTSRVVSNARPTTRVQAASGTLNSSSTSQPSRVTKPAAPASTVKSNPGGDDLLNAAQTLAWSFMSAKLEDEHGKAEKAIMAAFEARSLELDAEEEAVADARVRYETEQLLEFYEVLSHKEAPALRAVTKSFLQHEARCSDVSRKVMRLDNAPDYDLVFLHTCNLLLVLIDEQLESASRLESDIVELPDVFYQEPSRLNAVLQGLLSMVRSQKDTLLESRLVVQAQKKIAYMSLELQSLEL
ncbi:hypothetical protein BXZ70DRAFT_945766 [Cristinia sonorae]|uniref:Uncharacterized protein n=1 Tax=Cristinia sonorae TaxID=1940300 RepID=A0A8K0UK78_9AGAR|nr:hypothetical protein BXZ70DRAFT_945766 [Cristinia sonorae]